MKELPLTINEDNIDGLINRAELIHEKVMSPKLMLLQIMPFVCITTFLFFGSIFLMIWLGFNGYLDFLLFFPSELQGTMFLVTLFAFIGLVCVPISFFSILFFIWLSKKFGYPSHEEKIFSQCFIIAKHLLNNERLKAKNQVELFLSFLTNFVRDFGFNPRRKIYSQEFDVLRSGKNEFNRFLMFSETSNAKILMNFGLDFGRNDDPKAFKSLNLLLEEIKKFGEPAGKVKRFMRTIEQYSRSLPFLFSVIILLCALVYFLITGQKLPVG